MKRIAICLALLLTAFGGLGPQANQAHAGGLLSGLLGTSSSTRLVVRLSPDASVGRVTRVLRWMGVRVTKRYDSARLLVVETRVSLLSSLTRLLGRITRIAGVEIVEVDRPVESRDGFGGSQSQFATFEWDLNFSTMQDQPAFGAVGLAPTAHTAGAHAPRVAVLDGGFQEGHEALPEQAVQASWDAFDGDDDVVDRGNGYDDNGDGWVDAGVGHGHAVAALVRVIAPHSPLMLARVLDDEGVGSYSTVAAGLDWAVRGGADVVNLSAGAAQGSKVISQLLEEARAAGVVVVVAAGNESGDVTYPARDGRTLAITGLHADGARMEQAGSGYQVDLGAPGFEIVAPWPGTMNRYGRFSGTSFAAPITVGAIAVVARAHDVSAEEASTWIENSTRSYTQTKAGWQYGAGTGMLDVSMFVR